MVVSVKCHGYLKEFLFVEERKQDKEFCRGESPVQLTENEAKTIAESDEQENSHK